MDNLRILIYANPLVVDKIGKSFLYEKDSGFLYTKNLISSMPSTYRYSWLIPENIVDKHWFQEANTFVEAIPYPYSTSIHQNRYEFYGASLKKAFPYTRDIDAILCNQPEVSASLRTWAVNQRRDDPVILSFYHWLDCEASRAFAPELGGYFWRQYDGALASDVVLFHGSYAEELFTKECLSKVFLPELPSISYFTPPATKFGEESLNLPSKKIILFNHRLNATTNWKEFLKICDALYTERQDFVVWMTDDQNIQDAEEFTRPYLIVQRVPASQYGYLMQHAHFSVCNHKGYSTWNMAVIDSLYNGCFALVPKDEVYNTMFYDRDGLFYNRTDLKAKISMALDTSHDELQATAKRVVGAHAYFNNREGVGIDQVIQSKIAEKIGKTTPLKYDDVKNYIDSKAETKKSDLINKFWSFHVNSNFQKIRWQLLTDGIKDDVSKAETTYGTAVPNPINLTQLSF